MTFAIAAILLAVFTFNVSYGAMTGAPILSNVAEMLLLFGASIFFVAAILKREAEAKKKKTNNKR